MSRGLRRHTGRSKRGRRTRETRVRFQAASDQALLVYLGEEIGSAAHERVVQLLRLLQQEPLAWIRNIQPAYCSLLITFDAATVDHAGVQAKLSEYESRADKIPAGKARLVEVPVCYGGSLGRTWRTWRRSEECCRRKWSSCTSRERITRIFWDLRRGSRTWAIWPKSLRRRDCKHRGRKWLREAWESRDGKRRCIRSRRRVAGD